MSENAMIQRILAILTVSLLVAFMGVLAAFVNRPNLWIVVILGLGFAIYDFWTTARGEEADTTSKPSSRTAP